MPLHNYGRVPGFAPGGRGINPETGRIGDMPGGMDYLAGLGPAPKGVVDFNPAPIISPARLQNAGGIGNPLDAFTMGLKKWGNPNTNALAINMFNQRHGANLSANQLGVQVAAPPATITPSGRNATPAPPAAQFNFPNAAAPEMKAAGTLSSFDTQWNDQNDPGGFIRKFQAQQANQPWTPNWGNPGVSYGLGGTRGF